ncbi:MAG: hypothetical protein HY924_05110 [Elusimicrobia bacterium]|nr:hypothetical protein [Elusimicrobiota bacterium]
MSALAGNLSYRVCRFLFGKDKVVSTVRLGFHRGFTSAPLRGVIEKNLGRIYRHSLHRAPTAAEVAAVISEMASIQAETMVAMHSSGDELPTWLASTSVDLLPALEDLRLRGRGVIIASPHYGNHALFDVIATLGIPINMLYLYASSWETKATQNSLIRLWDVGLAAPGLMRALAANEVVLLIDDMDYFPDNRTADFFGEPFHPPPRRGPAVPGLRRPDPAGLRGPQGAPLAPGLRRADLAGEGIPRGYRDQAAWLHGAPHRGTTRPLDPPAGLLGPPGLHGRASRPIAERETRSESRAGPEKHQGTLPSPLMSSAPPKPSGQHAGDEAAQQGLQQQDRAQDDGVGGP